MKPHIQMYLRTYINTYVSIRYITKATLHTHKPITKSSLVRYFAILRCSHMDEQGMLRGTTIENCASKPLLKYEDSLQSQEPISTRSAHFD